MRKRGRNGWAAWRLLRGACWATPSGFGEVVGFMVERGQIDDRREVHVTSAVLADIVACRVAPDCVRATTSRSERFSFHAIARMRTELSSLPIAN